MRVITPEPAVTLSVEGPVRAAEALMPKRQARALNPAASRPFL
ncbi:hypothetical protein [Brevundimonas phoenicis]